MNQESEYTGPMQDNSPVKPRRIGLQVFLASLIALGVFAYLGYLTYVKAYVVLAKSVAQTAQHESASIRYVSDDEKTEILASLAGEDKLQEFRLSTKELGGELGADLSLAGRFDETNGYLQANYARPEEITELLKLVYPQIEKTKTYAMVAPLWMGESWLHFDIPKTEDEEVAEVEWNWNDKDMQKMAWDWFKAVKPGKIVKNYEYEGQEYTKIAFGFRKDQLIEAINSIKDMDVEVKVSQINSMVKLVESSDDWDKDLFTVLIDKKGDVKVVMMQMPKIEEKYLDDTIAESTDESQANPMTSSLISGAKNLLWKQEGEMVQLGIVTLDKFDEEIVVEKPSEVVEVLDVMAVAQTELGPIIAQLLGGTSTGTQPKTSTVAKPNTAPATANCIQYKIREGEFASDKCYSKGDYDDLVYYLQRYSFVVGSYNGEVAQANMTCGGQSEMFKQSCEESKVARQKYESEMQSYATTIRGIIAKGR